MLRTAMLPLPHNLAAIVFDFDGVILESAGIKVDAFRDIFSRYPAEVDAIVAYHKENAGMGRIEKLRIIYRDILKKPLSSSDEQQLNQEFADYVVARVLACPFVPGVLECLAWSAARYPLFVASGVPQDELQDIVARRDLAKFFKGVYGSPRNKVQILGDIQTEHGWASTQLLMVGDALTDSRAAAKAGTAFVGRVAEGGEDIFVDQPKLGVVRDLGELLGALRSPTDSSAPRRE
jgi:phosphoglycolate phosphatase-like HAD superfamily hydrolase